MKLFKTDQLRELDAMTIQWEGITSLDLMDRAAQALFQRIVGLAEIYSPVLVMAGPGNNGGDALAVARLLHQAGFQVCTALCQYGKFLSDDARAQWERLKSVPGHKLIIPQSVSELQALPTAGLIIDGLFGSGLNRPLEGLFAETVRWINVQPAFKVAIDLPSGLFGEDNRQAIREHVVKANLTLGLQFPRLAFLLPENAEQVGDWECLDIGIHPEAIRSLDTTFFWTDRKEITKILKKRPRFTHKGTFGRSLLIAGSRGMTGAAILAGRGAIRSGTGLLTLKVPAECLSIVQTALPEATAIPWTTTCWDRQDELSKWTAIGIGPGLSRNEQLVPGFQCLLEQQPARLVIDADGINLLSEHRFLIERLPRQAILTPHPGEFDRLTASSSTTGFERLETAIRWASAHQVYIILKGAYTACITPEGYCHFNSTGNAGLSTGGTGDVLTGMVVSLLAQGYTASEACRLGVYLHGLSADLALSSQSMESLIAGDVAEGLGKAFNNLHSSIPNH